MSNLTKAQIQDYQQQMTLFGQLIMTWDDALIRQYLEQTRLLADGTMDVILPHFMNLQEMHKGRTNLQFLREMGEHILAVRRTIQNYVPEPKKEAAHAG